MVLFVLGPVGRKRVEEYDDHHCRHYTDRPAIASQLTATSLATSAQQVKNTIGDMAQLEMNEIHFVDTTLRDGQMSLWATGMTTGMMLPVAETLDRAGFEAIEILAAAFFKKLVRELREDRSALLLAEHYGLEDNLMFANDYPHHEGTWPYSAECSERLMGHLRDDTRAKILGLNAARVFKFEVPREYLDS